jgi:hypothetical protein
MHNRATWKLANSDQRVFVETFVKLNFFKAEMKNDDLNQKVSLPEEVFVETFV